uniref:Adipogenesis associated Mth938 domain containing n=1 Tax=Mus musculus TaxID=10090 RepID=D6RJJ4_MOUSE
MYVRFPELLPTLLLTSQVLGSQNSDHYKPLLAVLTICLGLYAVAIMELMRLDFSSVTYGFP